MEPGDSVFIDITANDARNDGGTLQPRPLHAPDFGAVTRPSQFDPILEYTAPADFAGTAAFWYEIADNFNDGDGVDFGTATVFVTMTVRRSHRLGRSRSLTKP